MDTKEIEKIVNEMEDMNSSRMLLRFKSFEDGVLRIDCLDGRSLKHHPSRIFYDRRRGDEFIFNMDQDEYEREMENSIKGILTEWKKVEGIEEVIGDWEKAKEPEDWFNFLEAKNDKVDLEDGTMYKIQ